MRVFLLVGGALLLVGLSAACSNGSYSYAEVATPVGDPAATVDFAGTGSISIAEGRAVEAQITFVAHDGDQLSGELVSENANVLEVLPVMDASAYVFVGVSSGTTNVDVLVGAKNVQTIPATVSALPASSVPATITVSNPRVLDAGPDA